MLSAKTVWVCIALGLMALAAVFIFKVSMGTLLFAGALLACPLVHIWMMRSGDHKH